MIINYLLNKNVMQYAYAIYSKSKKTKRDLNIESMP